jgi:hypothetical protein
MIMSGMMVQDSALNQNIIADQQAVTASTTQAAGNTSITASSTVKTAAEVKTVLAKNQTNSNAKVESAVREYFSDIPLMAEIAKCESRFRQYDKDGSIFRGVVNNQDVGVLQINEYYHLSRTKKLGIDIYSVEGNMQYARLLYKEQGAQPWNSSSPCWMKSDVAKAMFAPKILAEATVIVK